MPAMRETIKAIRETGIPVKIVIGGAPVTADYAREIGANAYAANASSAVDCAMEQLRAKD
jgi:5-methyltetrahydrofolate--homocysteine methyltransferase